MKIIGNSDLDHSLEPDVVTTYWLSYDRDNMMIKYGKGYAMQETMLMQCDFNLAIKKASEFSPDVNFQKNNTNEKEDVKKQWSKFFNIYDTSREGVEIMVYRSPGDVVRSWEKSVGPGQKAGVIHTERMIKVRKEPLVVNPSPLVMPAALVTMSLIDRNQFLFSSELPLPCKMLYDTIIDCEPLRDKPNLIDAIRWDKFSVSQYKFFTHIRHSIVNEGFTLNKILKNKSYLRVPAGPSFGQSPGVPYVLEFWPTNSKSPIHNHGNVCGIVKVINMI